MECDLSADSRTGARRARAARTLLAIVKLPWTIALALIFAVAMAFQSPRIAREQRRRFEEAIPKFGLDQHLDIFMRKLSAGAMVAPGYEMHAFAEGSRDQVLALLTDRICAMGFNEPEPDAHVGPVHVRYRQRKGVITPGGIYVVSVMSFTPGFRIGLKGPLVPEGRIGLAIGFG